MKNAKKILSDARKLIQGGWCRNAASKLIGDKMHYCLSGAISTASTRQAGDYWDPGEQQARNAVNSAINDRFPLRIVTMIGFNDDFVKDKRQVVALLTKALGKV